MEGKQSLVDLIIFEKWLRSLGVFEAQALGMSHTFFVNGRIEY